MCLWNIRCVPLYYDIVAIWLCWFMGWSYLFAKSKRNAFCTNNMTLLFIWQK